MESDIGRAWIAAHRAAVDLEVALENVQALDPSEATEHDIWHAALIRGEAKRMAQRANLPADQSDLPAWARSY